MLAAEGKVFLFPVDESYAPVGTMHHCSSFLTFTGLQQADLAADGSQHHPHQDREQRVHIGVGVRGLCCSDSQRDSCNQDDVSLMLDNALLYNRRGSFHHRYALKVW